MRVRAVVVPCVTADMLPLCCHHAATRYPHIIFTPCTAHAIDLALEEIFKLEPFAVLLDNVKRVVTFINNHQHALAAYRALHDKVLALLKPGETRFATSFIMVQRAHQQSSDLQRLVVSEEWASVVGRLTGDDKAKAAEVKTICLNDMFWHEVQQVSGAVWPARLQTSNSSRAA